MKNETILLLEDLNISNPENIQNEAIKKLNTIDDLSIFMQPINDGLGKNTWENCAKILFQKSNSELVPYLDNLMEWLQDMNWPGAWIILERLQQFPESMIKKKLEKNIRKAKKELMNMGEKEVYCNSWLYNLNMIFQGITENDF